MLSRISVRTSILTFATALLLMLSACGGGGGGGTPNPNPNPGAQPAQAAPPNSAIMQAFYDNVLQELTVIGGSGSVLPNAMVTVRDPQAYLATCTADGSGAFILSQSDLPTGFWITPGTQLTVAQQTADTLPSERVTITVGP